MKHDDVRVLIFALRRNYKYIVIAYVFAACFYYYFHGHTLTIQNHRCTIEEGIEFIKELCHNYTHGYVTGSFCNSLCVKKELRYVKCMSHKVECVIMLAEWKDTKIVLKADGIGQTTRDKAEPTTYSGLMWSFIINNLPFPVAKHILSECDKGFDGLFTKTEALYCWHLHDRDEILYMFLLPDNSGIAKLYGVCGNVIAVEYATTDPLIQLPVAKEYRSWKLRARMSIALIEMIETLEDTKYGAMHLCDFQRANFGFVEVNGQLVAKSIDNDISLFRDSLHLAMLLEKNQTCLSDDHCNYIECRVSCDHSTGKCSGKLTNNNLQMLCSIILLSETRYFYTGLLWEPPASIKKDLSALLHRCAYPLTPSESIPRNVAKQLKELLRLSIKE